MRACPLAACFQPLLEVLARATRPQKELKGHSDWKVRSETIYIGK